MNKALDIGLGVLISLGCGLAVIAVGVIALIGFAFWLLFDANEDYQRERVEPTPVVVEVTATPRDGRVTETDPVGARRAAPGAGRSASLSMVRLLRTSVASLELREEAARWPNCHMTGVSDPIRIPSST